MIDDTIVAIATAVGKGGIGIVRASGKNVTNIIETIIGYIPKPRYATYTPFNRIDGTVIDEGICIYFKAPNSYTGEDVVEFQCHGGAIVLDVLLKEILNIKNTRIAKPGEFTERAFINGKIDLTQAEAISDIINASSEQALKCAVNSLQGKFSELIKQFNTRIINLRKYVEATIDFPDESIDFITDYKVLEQISSLIEQINSILKKAHQGVLLQEGINLVIAGKPNVGKSSLLNALCNNDSAIVTDIEGTTRDILKEHIQIDGLPIHIIDTAGIKQITEDIVEKIGIDKAWNEIKKANRILFIVDVSRENISDQINLFNEIKEKTNNEISFTIIFNKIDLNQKINNYYSFFDGYEHISISAKNNIGIDELRTHLKNSVSYQNTNEGVFSARRRHLKSLEKILEHLNNAKYSIKETLSFEIAAEELKYAQNNINDILGEFTPDDLLTEIFNTFCVGK
ncbi:MAG: tRNA uridine-5-carboxymethylaminomethyl(34) synthesis GTPase MnmE [Succinivibrionaceae bacterium]